MDAAFSPAGEVRLIPAGPDDAKALAQLATDSFTETFGHLYSPADLQSHLDAKCSASFFTHWIKQPGRHVLIAWAGAHPVGYISWGPLELPHEEAPAGSMEICRLYVLASHQGLKLGRRLIEAVLAATAHAPALYLGVWEHNHKAQMFYASYGFQPAGEHVYYVGSKADRDFIWVRA